jgi:hypothetical protein
MTERAMSTALNVYSPFIPCRYICEEKEEGTNYGKVLCGREKERERVNRDVNGGSKCMKW